MRKERNCTSCGMTFYCSGTCTDSTYHADICMCEECIRFRVNDGKIDTNGRFLHSRVAVSYSVKHKLCFGSDEEVTALLMTL